MYSLVLQLIIPYELKYKKKEPATSYMNPSGVTPSSRRGPWSGGQMSEICCASQDAIAWWISYLFSESMAAGLMMSNAAIWLTSWAQPWNVVSQRCVVHGVVPAAHQLRRIPGVCLQICPFELMLGLVNADCRLYSGGLGLSRFTKV